MCGFVGAFGPSAASLFPRLKLAIESIRHRGPDSEGEFYSKSGTCVLGHTRLSILDLSSVANQPMKVGALVGVYNGEIYNHEDLRKRFLPDFCWRSRSDTETLLALYEKKGHRALSDCIGMFATAIYSDADNSLILSRDPLGIKPLYVAKLPDSTYVFGSECRAIFALATSLSRKVRSSALSQYLAFENYAPTLSMFQEIDILAPGSIISLTMLDRSSVREEKIADLKTKSEQFFSKKRDACEFEIVTKETLSNLKTSVERHLISDVPLGVYLSGGIDSTLVSALAANSTRDLSGFTGFFRTRDPVYDETPLAALVAKRFKIHHHLVEITPRHFEDNFVKLCTVLEEPRMGMGAFSQYIVAREAARFRKVILAGHGGDELFAGYPLFKAFALVENPIFSGRCLNILRSMSSKEWPWAIDVLRHRVSGFARFAPQIMPGNLKVPIETEPFEWHPSSRTSALDSLNSYYSEVYLPGLLMVEDKISMAHSLETRVPIWSQPLVHWANGIPIEMKLYKGKLKSILKSAANGILPNELLTAAKRGFPTPLRFWFRDELKSFVHDRLLYASPELYSIVSRRFIAALLRNHEKISLPFALDERRAHRIWILLNLDAWFRDCHGQL